MTLPRGAGVSDGRLRAIGGCDVDELAAAHGTPLWVLDREELTGRLSSLTAALAAPADVVYAAKALCVTAVLQLVARAGASVDVASAGELATAVAAGVPGPRIVVHGNNKSGEELAAALDAGAGRIVIDGLDEVDRLAELAQRRGARVDCLLRLRPGVLATTHAHVATGHEDSKFGVSVATGAADAAVERISAAPGLRLLGFHSHVGSQVTVLDELVESAERTVAAAAGLAARHRLHVAELDVGGGLGIAYRSADAVLDPATWATTIREVVTRAARDHGLDPPRVLVEPGRAVVGPAGVTLYRVGTVKRGGGTRVHVAVDGGMSDNVRPALYGAVYEFWPAGAGSGGDAPSGEAADAAPAAVDVVGKHCESGDVLGWDVVLPAVPHVGELLAVAATGAYHHSMSSNYNRLPRPAMVLVGDGRADLVVRRETVADLLARDVPLPA